MRAHEKSRDVAKPSALKRDWRFYSGMAAMVLSVVVPLSAVFVPVLGLPTAQSAVLAGVLVAGVPEVLCILAVVLLGKDTFQYFAHQATRAFRRAILERPASKARYYVGLAIILLSWTPAYLYAYVPGVMPGGNARIYILAAMDLAFVASVVLMGGESGKRSGEYSSMKVRFRIEVAIRAARLRPASPGSVVLRIVKKVTPAY